MPDIEESLLLGMVKARFLLAGVIALSHFSTAGPPPVDTTTWELTSWRAWPFEYKEILARKAPLLVGKPSDWARVGDSWVAERKGTRDRKKRSVTGQVSGLKPETRNLNYTLSVTEFYLTGGGNENGPNRVFCATAVPKEPEGPFPALFVFHGGGGHASAALAVSVARRNPGFATVAVDYNGQYRPSKSPVTKWVTMTETIRERRHDLTPNPLNFPMYHNVQATRRVLDWTERQDWADTKRFGAVGISYGGWVSFILAGVDQRIRSVYTGVSAGGTDGTRGRSNQAQDWKPREQYPIWLKHAVPMAYAAKTTIPVFMKLAANDRFFWLSGAGKHRERLRGQMDWVLTPNCDHGKGGPDLPDPSTAWHRMVHMKGGAFPELSDVTFAKDGRSASIRIQSPRPIQSVHLAWSSGNPVSPARYWRWIDASEADGRWTARLPEGHSSLEGSAYFTAIDVDDRAISSDLALKSGQPISPAMEWEDGALWDTEKGADAWRSDLAFGKVSFEKAPGHRVKVVPEKPNSRISVLTNSLMLADSARTAYRGLRIELGGNGANVKIQILLARDYMSLDEQLFTTEVDVEPESNSVELPWDCFQPCSRKPQEMSIFPVNGLVIRCDAFPESGLIIGTAQWLE